ncbi:AAA family ATPase [Leeuwenhoekiella nanhaiensis]|uniref:Rad50/SbcC-type AAA domain-containing protein n=1 Tax=Leeuwenhoekiella nanhaiensis TaxID=1655491 RepID=A0A2G1VM89_9FLAO|nr:AAA family ATPase [Leeuwenhoekiella nanhaiensis]PHQ27878.1 hypothetical protein CJ305_17895 [Leeuwenhoekiella nanhaiensis]
MNQIKIKSLTLLNFKGIRKLHIDDFGPVTSIFGDNGTGKTSIFDAFTWLLFGKDSADRTAFEIKTLDKSNNVIPKLEHEVTAILEVNGELVELKRILREKWVTKRGSEVAEFSGNETVYFWNEVPLSAGDYSKKVSDILDEKIFKMITNPIAFNSLKWQDRRNVLIDMVGGITDEEIARGDKDFENLIAKLSNKSLEEYQSQVGAKLKKMKAELKLIPTRIDEVERGKPEAINFDQIDQKMGQAEKEIEKIDAQMRDELEAEQGLIEQKREIKKRINDLEDKVIDIKHKARKEAYKQYSEASSEVRKLRDKLSELDAELETADRGRDTLAQKKEAKEKEIEALKNQNKALGEKWKAENAKVFEMDENACKCPTCKRELEAEDIDAKRAEFEENFNKNKRQTLESINATGKANTDSIKLLEAEIKTLDERIAKGTDLVADLKSQMDSISKQIDNADTADLPSENEIYDRLIKENEELEAAELSIKRLTEKADSLKKVDTSELEAKKREVKERLNELALQYNKKDQIKAADQRIEELAKEETAMAQEIASQEREQFVIENFIKAKIETLEKRINSKFEIVSFKMFNTQINGGQTETCDTLIDGVPFSDANTASKINAGIDIINTLTNYYQINAPIFIDNRESVVNLIPSKSQIINLIVSESDQKLRVATQNKRVAVEA